MGCMEADMTTFVEENIKNGCKVLQERKNIINFAAAIRRDGRVVDCGGLENR